MSRRVVALGLVTLLAVGVWSLAMSQSQEGRKGEKEMRLAKPRITPLTEAEWTHGKRTSTALKTKELRQVGNMPPGPFAFDFHRAFARIPP